MIGCLQVNVVRARLELLGAEISPDLLDLLGSTMNSQHEISVAMLREIDCVFALDEKCKLLDVTPCPLSKEVPYLDSGTRLAANSSHREDESRSHVHHYFSDILILIDMLSVPSLTIEASGAFERGVAHGYIDNQVVALVLEKHAERFSANSAAREKNAESLFSEEFFTSVLALAETLSLSINSQVHNFVKMFYVTLFEVFSGESYHTRMLRGQVDLATSPVENSLEMNLDVLIFLVHREHGFARPVLKMVGDAAKHDNADHSAIRHRLRCLEEKIIHIGEEKRAELSNISSEKATLLERLTETEAALLHYKVFDPLSAYLPCQMPPHAPGFGEHMRFNVLYKIGSLKWSLKGTALLVKRQNSVHIYKILRLNLNSCAPSIRIMLQSTAWRKGITKIIFIMWKHSCHI